MTVRPLPSEGGPGQQRHREGVAPPLRIVPGRNRTMVSKNDRGNGRSGPVPPGTIFFVAALGELFENMVKFVLGDAYPESLIANSSARSPLKSRLSAMEATMVPPSREN